MKVAISLPDDVLERLDAAAVRAGLNRSEFFRAAGLRFAVELEVDGLTHAIDRHLDDVAQHPADARAAREVAAVAARGRAALAAATAGDEW